MLSNVFYSCLSWAKRGAVFTAACTKLLMHLLMLLLLFFLSDFVFVLYSVETMQLLIKGWTGLSQSWVSWVQI